MRGAVVGGLIAVGAFLSTPRFEDRAPAETEPLELVELESASGEVFGLPAEPLALPEAPTGEAEGPVETAERGSGVASPALSPPALDGGTEGVVYAVGTDAGGVNGGVLPASDKTNPPAWLTGTIEPAASDSAAIRYK